MLQRIPPLARFEESPVRRLVAEKMRAAAIGEVVPYSALSEVIGGDAQGAGRHLVASARAMLLKEGILFDAVTNVGLKRLDDVGALDATESHLNRSRRAVKRASRTLAVSNYEALPEPEKKRHGLYALRIAVQRQFSGRGAIGRLGNALAAGVSAGNMRKQLSGVLSQFGASDESPK